LRLLVLGGTKFLGRAIVDAALARAHEVTLFNRGQTNPELFPDVEKLRGERDGDLSALEGRAWDAVIDPSGYVPRVVRASAEFLAGAAEHYTFVSSISVYDSYRQVNFDETAPLEELADPTTENVDEAYGGLKALCERVVEDVFPGAALVVRAGLIVGPHDPTGRFTYWPHRLARGGEVLAPQPPERQVQFVDVRDLADWIVRMAEVRTAGAFNAVGPVPTMTMGGLLEACRSVTGGESEIVWVDEAFLLEHEVGSWMELPLWLPEAEPDYARMMEADVSKATAVGLTFRPVADTIRATLDQAELTDAAGLAPEREAELLAAWRSR
jgi:2'-hydroxyisoflavone reductase